MNKVEITLCMIVKNEDKYLDDCLASVNDLVSEMIVVDTGSSDSTLKIAKKYGAKIFDYEWDNDFSKARNFSLKQATKPWILVLDADERLEKSDQDIIRTLIMNDHVDAYFLNQINYAMDSDSLGWEFNHQFNHLYPYLGYIKIPLIRLFRNASSLVFSGIIHEHVFMPENKKSISTAVSIHHIGKMIDHTRTHKVVLYQKLTKEKYEAESSNPHIVFEYAKQCYVTGQWDEALSLTKKLITYPDYINNGLVLMAFIYYRKNNYHLVKDTLMDLMKSDPTNPQIYIIMPLVLAGLGYADLICQFIALGKKLANQYPAFFLNASYALEDIGETVEAINLLLPMVETQGIKNVKSVACQLLRRISELYFKIGNQTDALRFINGACLVMPLDPQNLYQKSVIYYHMQQYDQSQSVVNLLTHSNVEQNWKNKIDDLRHSLNLINNHMKGEAHVIL